MGLTYTRNAWRTLLLGHYNTGLTLAIVGAVSVQITISTNALPEVTPTNVPRPQYHKLTKWKTLRVGTTVAYVSVTTWSSGIRRAEPFVFT